MSYQFMHIEAFAREAGRPPPSRGGRAKRPKLSARAIVREAYRAPDAAPHVADPRAPRVLLGAASIDDALARLDAIDKAADQVRVDAGSGRTRKQRRDTPTLLGVVASYPGAPDDNDPRYRAWRQRVLDWVRRTWSDVRILSVVEHVDEPHGHIHALVHDQGHSVKQLHPGHAAAHMVVRAGGTDKAAGEAYKLAMRQVQDDYHRAVGEPSGQARIGPGRARLSRAEWKHAQAIAGRLADAQARVAHLEAAMASRTAQIASLEARVARDGQRLEETRTGLVERARGLVERSRELDARERRLEAQEARMRAERLVLQTQEAERARLAIDVQNLRQQIARLSAGDDVTSIKQRPHARPEMGG